MSTTTENLGLFKPDLNDVADITQMNKNWDTLDEKIANMPILNEDGKVPEEQLPDTTFIPVTNEVPDSSDIWIDPDDFTIEEQHINDFNNPHQVTKEQIGALGYKTMLTSNDDINNIVEDGVYYYPANNVPTNAPFNAATVIFVFGAFSSTTAKIQLAIKYSSAGRGKFRTLSGGNWTNWAEFAGFIEDTDYPGCYYRYNNQGTKEWVNPPMVLGTEYRTTRRYKNSPVYVMAVSIGTMPASSGGQKNFTVGASSDTIYPIDYSIVVQNSSGERYKLPMITKNGTIYTATGRQGGIRTFNIFVQADMSSYTGEAYVEYIKL